MSDETNRELPDDLVTAMETLGVHDHLCLIYETREEQFAAVMPFMEIGLGRGEKCIYIVDDNTAATVIDGMKDAGIRVERAVESGELAILSKQDVYLKDGYFDPDWMIDFLKRVTDEAKAAGFPALRVTGEMTWVLSGDPGTGRLMEYEAKLNYFFPENDALAICQYNRNRFPPEIIKGVISTHPLVIYGGMVCRNVYYVPPDDFLLGDQPAREIERLLANIKRNEQTEEELRRHQERLEELVMVRTAELSRSNEALRDSEQRLSTLIDFLPDATLAIDKEKRVVIWNRAIEEMTGISAQEMIGKGDHAYSVPFYGTARPQLMDLFWSPEHEIAAKYPKLRREGDTLVIEAFCPDLNGGAGAFVWAKAVPLRDAEGRLAGAIECIRDITERRRAEEELAKLNEDLEQRVSERTALLQRRTEELEEANEGLKEVDRLKSTFISSMSHELRTPLNAIIGFSTVLLEEWLGPVNAEQKQNLASILSSGRNLFDMISDVLEVTQIESGTVKPVVEEFDLYDLLTEAQSRVTAAMREKGLELKGELLHLSMRTDRRRLLQCVLSMLSNAAKYSDKGVVTVAARIVSAPGETPDAEMTEIAVTDTGIGIGEEDRLKIFQPFFRIISLNRAIIPGTGLGLYLTRKIATEILKGDILVSSEYGKGSRFFLRIPVRLP